MKADRLRLSDPQGMDPKGSSAMPADAEGQIAQRRVLAENIERIKELERNIVDVNKVEADQKAQLQRAKSAAGQAWHMAHVQGWQAVCTQPDFCKVGDAVVAFDSFATLDDKQTASPNVKARGTPVYREGDTFRTVQANAGKGIESGTSLGTGHVTILDGQTNVKVNGKPVARHDSCVRVNCDAAGKGGAMGKLVTEQKSVRTGTAKGISHPLAPPGQRTSDRLKKLKAERAELKARQFDFDAGDKYVRIDDTDKTLSEQISRISGKTATPEGDFKEVIRGALGKH